MYIIFGVIVLSVISAVLIWYYDLMVTTIQIVIISSLIFVLFGIVFFQVILKDKLGKGGGATMPAAIKMVEMYNKYFENDITLRNSVIRRRPIVMNKEGDVNEFVAMYAPLKDESIGGAKLLYYNITVGDVYDIVDRPKAVEGKSIDPFKGWYPSKDRYNTPNLQARKEDWMPLGIRKEKSEFDTSVAKEENKK